MQEIERIGDPYLQILYMQVVSREVGGRQYK